MVVRTTDGTLACGGIARGKVITPFTQAQAEADRDARNAKAEELGIPTRYEVAAE